MRRLVGVAVVAAISIFAVAFVFLTKPIDFSISNSACTADEDCAAEQCCHPTSALNKAYAPDCSGVACTMDCRPETIDCGQGEIKCVEGICQAVLK